jgi:hypothetical protein
MRAGQPFEQPENVTAMLTWKDVCRVKLLCMDQRHFLWKQPGLQMLAACMSILRSRTVLQLSEEQTTMPISCVLGSSMADTYKQIENKQADVGL